MPLKEHLSKGLDFSSECLFHIVDMTFMINLDDRSASREGEEIPSHVARDLVVSFKFSSGFDNTSLCIAIKLTEFHFRVTRVNPRVSGLRLQPASQVSITLKSLNRSSSRSYYSHEKCNYAG